MIYCDLSLGRTGTSSRAFAARVLGVKPVIHYPDLGYFPRKDGSYVSDSTLCWKAKELLAYHGSNIKFIYVVRDLETWLTSWRNHSSKRKKAQDDLTPKLKAHRTSVYGQSEFDEDEWASVWFRHQDYILGLPEEQTHILHYWFEVNDKWKWSKMGNFLNKMPEVELDFPHVNRS